MAQDKKLSAGQRFGRWMLEGDEPLGRGGNGAVWRVRDDSGTQAAMKFLHRNHFNTKRHARFKDEIEFMRRHTGREGILPLLDSNSPDNPTADDRPWLVTPLAVPFNKLGLSSAAKLDDLVRRMEQVARTLSELHAQGMWHRDLKPDNLFDLNGAAMVGDFGLVDFPDKGPVTEPTEIMGPMFYVAPEMMRDAADVPAGPADVYAFAKTLWVLASGQNYPLPGEQRAENPQLRLSTNCPHPRAGILDRLIEQSTRHDPKQRPTMREVADELAAWLTPTRAVDAPIDFESLAREYSGYFEIGSTKDRRRKEFLQEAQGILSSFDGMLERIAAQTAGFTRIPPQVGTVGDLPPHLSYAELSDSARVLWRGSRGVETETGDIHRVKLTSFVQVEALDTEEVRIVVGHLVRYYIGSSDDSVEDNAAWIDEATEPAGTARLQNEEQRLYSGIATNLLKGLEAFGEQVKAVSEE